MKLRQITPANRERILRTGATALAVLLVCAGANAQQKVPAKNFPPMVMAVMAPVVTPIKAVDEAPPLDAKRLFALGMIETGNDDGEVGAAGEVSRYQIHPAVWKAYSQRVDYRNPAAAVQVARAHWAWLAEYFVEKAGRPPTDFDMYVLWNTKFGFYARRGFSRGRLTAVVKDRAERFVNLVNR